MKVTIYVLSLLLATSLLACSNSTTPSRQQGSDTPANGGTTDTPGATNPGTTNPGNGVWELLDRGSQCAMTEAKQSLVKNADEFAKLWNAAFEGYMPKPAVPKVDFSQKYVVAAFQGEQISGGFEVDIVGVTDQTITVQHTKPGAGCMSASVISYPYVFAAVPHSAGNAKFKVVEKAVPCE